MIRQEVVLWCYTIRSARQGHLFTVWREDVKRDQGGGKSAWIPGWDERLSGSLAHRSKAQSGDSLATSHQQSGVQTRPGQQGSARIVVRWEDRRHQSSTWPSFFFIVQCDTVTSWSSSGQLSWFWPSQLLVHSQPLAGECEKLKPPWHCVSTTDHQLTYQGVINCTLIWNPIQGTICWQRIWGRVALMFVVMCVYIYVYIHIYIYLQFYMLFRSD